MIPNPYSSFNCGARKGEYTRVYQKCLQQPHYKRNFKFDQDNWLWICPLVQLCHSHMEQWCDFNVLCNCPMTCRIWRMLKTILGFCSFKFWKTLSWITCTCGFLSSFSSAHVFQTLLDDQRHLPSWALWCFLTQFLWSSDPVIL